MHVRDANVCLVTRNGANIEACHIVPFSVGREPNNAKKRPFWDMLRLFIGDDQAEALRRFLFGTVPAIDNPDADRAPVNTPLSLSAGDSGSVTSDLSSFPTSSTDASSQPKSRKRKRKADTVETAGTPLPTINRLENMLSLSPQAHIMFDAGEFILVPIDPITPTEYRVRFEWMCKEHEQKADRFTCPNVTTDARYRTDSRTCLLCWENGPCVRRTGDVLTFHTNDPVLFALPNPELLRLHAALSTIQHMAARAGPYDPDVSGVDEPDPPIAVHLPDAKINQIESWLETALQTTPSHKTAMASTRLNEVEAAAPDEPENKAATESKKALTAIGKKRFKPSGSTRSISPPGRCIRPYYLSPLRRGSRGLAAHDTTSPTDWAARILRFKHRRLCSQDPVGTTGIGTPTRGRREAAGQASK